MTRYAGLPRRGLVTGGLAAALSTVGLLPRSTGTDTAGRTGAVRDDIPPARHASRPLPGTRPFVPLFPHRGLVTNEYAYRHPGAADARTSRDWTVTSGSLLSRWGCGWSGVPDGDTPDPASRLHTGSAVLRAVSGRRDFGDVTLLSRFFLRPPGETPRTPATAWDGGHLWLRYRSAQELYALSFCRRDGTVALKRKAPPAGAAAGTEGLYTTLAQARAPLRHDTWHQVVAQAVTTAAGSVLLRLQVDGRTVVRAEDTAPGALSGPGGVGVRGDNTELYFHGFAAVPSPVGQVLPPAPVVDRSEQ
ncbi:hypothetical protein [Streptomyces longwoodensis]|uniref:hypothetical protein n=1 Tax=Streptomyces longwoodensis TaxID=68231 RepID=UPI0033DDAC33